MSLPDKLTSKKCYILDVDMALFVCAFLTLSFSLVRTILPKNVLKTLDPNHLTLLDTDLLFSC